MNEMSKPSELQIKCDEFEYGLKIDVISKISGITCSIFALIAERVSVLQGGPPRSIILSIGAATFTALLSVLMNKINKERALYILKIVQAKELQNPNYDRGEIFDQFPNIKCFLDIAEIEDSYERRANPDSFESPRPRSNPSVSLPSLLRSSAADRSTTSDCDE